MSQVKGLCVMDVDGTLIAEEVIDLQEKKQVAKKKYRRLQARQCEVNWTLKQAYEREWLC